MEWNLFVSWMVVGTYVESMDGRRREKREEKLKLPPPQQWRVERTHRSFEGSYAVPNGHSKNQLSIELHRK